MSKIIVTEYVTLDGVMEAPHTWHDPWFSKEVEAYKSEELAGCDRLLMGKVTHDEFAPVWPMVTDDIGYAEKMNSMPKFVVSKTKFTSDWNNTHVITGDINKEIAKLKEQPGGDILVFGSATLVNSLLNTGLVDEYRIMIFPVVVGSGKRLFQDGSKLNSLTLDSVRQFESGVVNLIYRK